MNAQPKSEWELVREFGLVYSAGEAHPPETELRWPAVAEHIPGCGYLIVDEFPVLTPPARTDCRTMLYSEARTLVYNSKTHGIIDGYGCPVDGGAIAILARERREILIQTWTGECIRRIELPRISKHPPRILAWTHRGTFLVNFLARELPFDIAELDIHGRVIWSLVGHGTTVGLLGSMQLLADDSILVANEVNHVVQELHRDGSVSTRWGTENVPSVEHGYLSGPKWARQLDDGTLLIADTNNHRCLVIEPGDDVSEIRPANAALLSPSYVTRLPSKNFLVCDAGVGCIYELDSDHKIAWRMGSPPPLKRHFSFPRSVQYLGSSRYLVADTAHNRIVELNAERLRDIPVIGSKKLFWPRAARRTPDGTILVADGRNSRVLQLSPNGRVLRQLTRLRHEDRTIELQDPHDVRLLPNDKVLITDSAQNLVVESDWDGHVVWAVGLDGESPINDPHSAQKFCDGRLMIVDSGNHRILFIDTRTGTAKSVTEFSSTTIEPRLNYPRYAEITDDGSLVIADTHNNRVLAVDPDGNVLWELRHIPKSDIPFLRVPRWAHFAETGDLVVCDHFNHRIVHIRRRDGY